MRLVVIWSVLATIFVSYQITVSAIPTSIIVRQPAKLAIYDALIPMRRHVRNAQEIDSAEMATMDPNQRQKGGRKPATQKPAAVQLWVIVTGIICVILMIAGCAACAFWWWWVKKRPRGSTGAYAYTELGNTTAAPYTTLGGSTVAPTEMTQAPTVVSAIHTEATQTEATTTMTESTTEVPKKAKPNASIKKKGTSKKAQTKKGKKGKK